MTKQPYKNFMSKELIKDYGYVEAPVTEDQYFLGANLLPLVEIRPDGQWGEFLPVYEDQKRGRLETSNCAVYGTLNCLETLHRCQFGDEVNHSERYSGTVTGTKREGNDPHLVIEKTRKDFGLVSENLLPFSEEINSWERYYSPNPMSERYLQIGKQFLELFAIGHEWVFTDGTLKVKQQLLKEALKFSPLGVSVRAWKENSDGLFYKKIGEKDTHWVMLYGYKEGEYWLIYDHYDKGFKRLVWDYDFGRAKRYSLEKITPEQQRKVGLLTKLRDLLIELIIKIAPAGLGEKLRYGLERE